MSIHLVEIYKAVCDEIAAYYVPKGWKYAKSRPKLTYNDKKIKIEIAFWSSSSNMQGESVDLEILPAIYSLDLKKDLKSKGVESSGCILGYPAIFCEKLVGIPKGIKRVINLKGRVSEYEEEYEETSVLRHLHSINVYGITISDFLAIINFINTKIIVWKDLLTNDYKELERNIKHFLRSDVKQLKTGDFAKYIQYQFSENYNEFEKIEN